MIKCNVTVCGTIGRNASARTNKEGNSFLSFPLRVTIPDRDGQNEVIEISVSKDGSQEEASGYRNGSHVEITGTLFLKRRGDKLYFNLLQTVSIRLPQTRRIFSKEIWHFAVKWAKYRGTERQERQTLHDVLGIQHQEGR